LPTTDNTNIDPPEGFILDFSELVDPGPVEPSLGEDVPDCGCEECTAIRAERARLEAQQAGALTRLQEVQARLTDLVGSRAENNWLIHYQARQGYRIERITLTPPGYYLDAEGEELPEEHQIEQYRADVLAMWAAVSPLYPSTAERLYLSMAPGETEPGTYSAAPLFFAETTGGSPSRITVLATGYVGPNATLVVNTCGECETVRPTSRLFATCACCYRPCYSCGDLRRRYDLDDNDNCPNCQYYAHCYSCGDGVYEDDAYYLDYEDEYFCRSCFNDRRSSPPEPHDMEQPPEPGDFDGVSLFLSDMDGQRTVRRVGLEIEGGGDQGGLADHLNTRGVSPYSGTMGWHHQTRLVEGSRHDEARGWSVESDATVDWEVVSPVLDLSDPIDASLAEAGVRAIQEYIEGGSAWLDYRAGLHIHVGTERLPIEASYRVGRLWTYLEDVIFRFSAAKWGVHRTIQSGEGYCEPVDKRMKTQQDFNRTVRRLGRYNALSFQNYLQAHLSNCQCGNCAVSSWDTCTCENLGKCTFEFRVFNSTTNIVKMKAYIAFCIALISYAERMEPLTDAEWDQSFPDMEFTGNRLGGSIGAQHAERLNFILNELPLTEDEKDAILYCVRNSDLAAVESQLTITDREEVVA
jgi:hypothetical protein